LRLAGELGVKRCVELELRRRIEFEFDDEDD
jgi:hypothetical protein